MENYLKFKILGIGSNSEIGCASIAHAQKMVKELNLEPIARLVNFASAGVEPRIMGIGPVKAIPKALSQAGLTLKDIDLIELNEAFASQALAVTRELGLNPDIINVNGGAIALGHPLGCTGAKLSVQLFEEMRLRKSKYGIVSMCVGTGQGTAGVFEFFTAHGICGSTCTSTLLYKKHAHQGMRNCTLQVLLQKYKDWFLPICCTRESKCIYLQ